MQNTVRKLMEGIVARKLARDLEDREIFPANQGGRGRGQRGGGGEGGGGRPGKLHL